MIGERLKELRAERALLQKDLAEKLGITQQSISFYEAGKREPDNELLGKFADFFNVSVDYLLGRTDIRESSAESATPEEKYPPVHDVEEAMKIILEQPGLMLKGEALSDESKIILANAIQMGLRTAEEINSKKKDSSDTNTVHN